MKQYEAAMPQPWEVCAKKNILYLQATGISLRANGYLGWVKTIITITFIALYFLKDTNPYGVVKPKQASIKGLIPTRRIAIVPRAGLRLQAVFLGGATELVFNYLIAEIDFYG
ncbi:hypothetical protein [Pontibacter liquoris]|uniref:hypothetical protein n=1 Tax=Pontibacter liquoris TaxID=2905677 RepID=UPI001FA7E18E|nr:hypothetical protein [Pontibacter liquoris]